MSRLSWRGTLAAPLRWAVRSVSTCTRVHRVREQCRSNARIRRVRRCCRSPVISVTPIAPYQHHCLRYVSVVPTTRPRGTQDVFPGDLMREISFVEQTLIQTARRFGFEEIRTPVIEIAQTFARSLGDGSEVVSKQMYTFPVHEGKPEDGNFALRPENTAGVVRACIQRGWMRDQPAEKLFYLGPMFRRERPQRGRSRQFSQFGVECVGASPGTGNDSALQDVEIIQLAHHALHQLGVHDHTKLHINSLGDDASRKAFETALSAFLCKHVDRLSSDSKRRVQRGNSLRVLDSKSRTDREVLALGAPRLESFMSEPSKERFRRVLGGLDRMGVPYTVDPFLVRGLDYYGHTVFEFIDQTRGGQQNAVLAGGRYNALFESMGGFPTPAIGWAAGIDRLVLLRDAVAQSGIDVPLPPHLWTVVVLAHSHKELEDSLAVCEMVRKHFRDQHKPSVVVHWSETVGLKKGLKKAIERGADACVIVGEDELRNGAVTLKLIAKDSEDVRSAHRRGELVLQAALPTALEQRFFGVE